MCFLQQLVEMICAEGWPCTSHIDRNYAITTSFDICFELHHEMIRSLSCVCNLEDREQQNVDHWDATSSKRHHCDLRVRTLNRLFVQIWILKKQNSYMKITKDGWLGLWVARTHWSGEHHKNFLEYLNLILTPPFCACSGHVSLLLTRSTVRLHWITW